MNDPAAARHYRLTRPNGLGFIHRRSAAQFAICCAGIGLGLLGLVVTGAGIGGRIGLAAAGVLLVASGAGRTPGGEDLVALAGPFARFSARRITGRHRWSAALAPWRGAGLPPLFAGIALYDFDAERALGRNSGRVGLISDRGDGSLSLVLRVHGEGFLLADAAEKDARLAAFGDALASLAREESPVSRVTWSQLVAPAPLAGHFAYLSPDESRRARRGDRLFLRRPPRRDRSAGGLLRSARHAHRRHRAHTRGSRRGERPLLFGDRSTPRGSRALHNSARPGGALRRRPAAGRRDRPRAPGPPRPVGQASPRATRAESCRPRRTRHPGERIPALGRGAPTLRRDRRERPPDLPRRRVAATLRAGGLARRIPLRAGRDAELHGHLHPARAPPRPPPGAGGGNPCGREHRRTRAEGPEGRCRGASRPARRRGPRRGARIRRRDGARRRSRRRHRREAGRTPRAVRAHLPVGGERRDGAPHRSTSATPRRSSPRSPSAVSSRDGHDELGRPPVRAPRRWSSRDKAPCSPSRVRRKENRASCASAGSR